MDDAVPAPDPNLTSEVLRQVTRLAEEVARLHSLVDQTARHQEAFVREHHRFSETLYSPEDGLVVQVREIKTVGRFAARVGWAVVSTSGGSFLVLLGVAWKGFAALEAFRQMVAQGMVSGG